MYTWITTLAGILAVTFASHVAGTSVVAQRTICTNPRIRKEWRMLKINERKKYIEAVKCMMTKPAKFKKDFPIIESRFDDFVALHVNTSLDGRSPDVVKSPDQDGPGEVFIGGHDKMNILPWHRYLITLWEDAIIEECGWHLGVPYWNWYWDVPDAGGHFNKSPVWDQFHGFGGNGLPSNETSLSNVPALAGGPLGISRGTGGGCVTDGPFKDTKFGIGPLGQMKPDKFHCLTRDVNAAFVDKYGGIAKVRKTVSANNFKEFMDQVSGPDSHFSLPGANSGPRGHGGHGGVNGGGGHSSGPLGQFPSFPPSGPMADPNLHLIAHTAIGGEMLDPLNSLNEPLFYLHHGAIDYYWSIWQEHDRKKNLYDLDAGAKRDLGEKAGLMTVEMGAFAPTRMSKQVADPQNKDGSGILCFKYEGPTVQDYLSDPPPQAPQGP